MAKNISDISECLFERRIAVRSITVLSVVISPSTGELELGHFHFGNPHQMVILTELRPFLDS